MTREQRTAVFLLSFGTFLESFDLLLYMHMSTFLNDLFFPHTITLTTFTMATACIIMVFVPEYKNIGITATIIVMIARMLQGFSSLGEVMGAQLYLIEILKVPYRCIASGIVVWFGRIGGFFALITASIVLSTDGINWRWAFGVGAFVAVIGVFARLRLRETPEFADYQKDC